MTEVRRIQLHLGKCIEDLDKMHNVPDLKTKRATLLCKTAQKLFESAEDARAKGDEEYSYVYYMKYLRVVAFISKDKEYLKDKSYFTNMLGVKNPTKALDAAEKLKISLIDRYSREQKVKRLNDIKENELIKQKIEENRKKAMEVVSLNEPTPPLGLPDLDEVIISSEQLYQVLKSGKLKVMILDARPGKDFVDSHINHPACISVPEECISPGQSANVLEQNLPAESRPTWAQRASMDLIVLLDWSSATVIPGKTLFLLKTILLRWDVKVQYSRPPLALKGGYEDWVLKYPALTNNPHAAPPRHHDAMDDMLGDIDYPEWNDTPVTSPTTVPSVPGHGLGMRREPTVDRTSKVAALQVYEERARKMQHILEQQEHIADTSLSLEQQRIDAEQDWEKVHKQRELEPQDAVRSLYKLREQEIISQLMQLENKQYDMEQENQSLRERLEEYQRKEREEAEKLAESIASVDGPAAEAQGMYYQQENQSLRERLEEYQRKEREEAEKLAESIASADGPAAEAQGMYYQQENQSLRERLEEYQRKEREEAEKLAESIASVDGPAAEAQGMYYQQENQSLRERLEEYQRKEREEAEKLAESIASVDGPAAEAQGMYYQQENQSLRERLEEYQRKEREEAEKLAESIASADGPAAEAQGMYYQQENQSLRERLEEYQRKEREEAEKLAESIASVDGPAAEAQGMYYQQENQSLRERLEEYQRKEREEAEKLAESIASADGPAAEAQEEAARRQAVSARRIAVAEAQRRLLLRTREQLERDRTKRLEQARAKRKPTDKEDDGEDSYMVSPGDSPGAAAISRSHSDPNLGKQISSDEEEPPTPVFDRSTKPTKVPFSDHQRDFQPVWGEVGRGLTGLKNLGNTCYMNSIIQCLNNTAILVTYFCNGQYQEHVNRSHSTRGAVAEELAAVVRALWSGQCRFIATRDLRNEVGKHQRAFRGCEQQDSHEFLTILMDWLHLDLQFTIPQPHNKEALPASEKAWHDYTKSKESLILRLFHGQIKSTVQCTVCGKQSLTYDSFSNLSLELPPNATRCSLSDCLKLYLNGETIPGWNCPNCKEKRDALKKLDISRLPPVLVIHFKRFYVDPKEYMCNSYRKRQTYIDFPLEDLDMRQFSLHCPGNNLYNLYAVSNHYGSMEGGHYTAYCKSSVYGKWYKYDDHVVSEISPSEVKSSAAYILFYTSS